MGNFVRADGHRSGADLDGRAFPPAKLGLNLFIAQLVVNFFWSLIFFNLQAFGFAFAWLLILWVLVALMTVCFYLTDRLAAWLQVPYILWLTFAAYLCAGAWLLNG